MEISVRGGVESADTETVLAVGSEGGQERIDAAFVGQFVLEV